MEDLEKYFKHITDKLSVFMDDLQRMVFNEVQPEKKKDMKSLQKVTQLRSTTAEAKEAAENPEMAFIKDTLNDIFKG